MRHRYLVSFDNARLQPVAPSSVRTRNCPHTEALVAACRLGAGPATRPWARPWEPARIEWPFGVLQVDDAEVARRACLQLDGSWCLADAASAAGRLTIRARAQIADLAWWRPLHAGDAWDAGWARNPGALAGFAPRRATLIVIDGEPDAEGRRALDGLARQADALKRALRVVVVGGLRGPRVGSLHE